MHTLPERSRAGGRGGEYDNRRGQSSQLIKKAAAAIDWEEGRGLEWSMEETEKDSITGEIAPSTSKEEQTWGEMAQEQD